MPSFTGLHHVALAVTDVERSVPWYERVLRFSTVGRQDDGDSGLRKVFLRGPGVGLELTLVQYPRIRRPEVDTRSAGLEHLSFSVPDEECLRRWTDRLTEYGVVFTSVEDSAHNGRVGSGRISLHDPDGIQLVILVEPGLKRPGGL